ncbi:DNA internalization-related competence protein ComEC/Rec2 [Hydrogenophaga sp. MI9]|uniref:DNA internalization-related competence protein ComEC/Rec2 n=1 Tax=Hydrogenophaga sp. MI9 TaxID=3453719 RepID=UPI003EE9CD80
MMHPVWAALPGVVLGVALQLLQARLWTGSTYAILLLVAALLALLAAWTHRRRWHALVPVAAGLLAGALAAGGWTGLRAVHFAAHALAPGLEGVDITLDGQIASMPQRGADSDRFEFSVDRATRDGQAVRVPPRLLIGDFHGPAAGRAWRAGDAWRLVVRLRRPHGQSNPYGFDRERWLWEQGIGATGSLRDGPHDTPPVWLGRPGLHPVEAARQWVGERIAARVTDPRSAGVLAALVVGDQSAIDHQDWALFRQTGVAHLMSISGLHVTAFAWLATLWIGAGWRRLAFVWPGALMALPAPVAAGWGGVIAAAAYALFADWGVPAQRTVLMLALVVGLRLSARRWPWPMVWLLAMVAVLLLDPWALLQPGFWLSFVAVGILFAANDPGRVRHRSGNEVLPRWRRVLRPALALLREQGQVTVALAPLGLLLFGQVSVVGLIANLFAIPWVTFLVTPLAMLGVVVPPLWDATALVVQWLVALLEWLNQWGWAAVFRPIPPWPLAVCGVLGGLLLMLRLPLVLRSAGLLMVAPMLLWSPARPAAGEFEVMAVDVGQGSALLVRTAGHSLLYDTGPRYGAGSDAGDRVVVPLLRALGEAPATVVVSHRDSDHSGGSAAVRAAWPAARWLASFGEGERCLAGQRWTWDGVSFEVLHPAPDLYGPDGEGRLSTNAMSCVLRIDNGRRSAWLSGDLDAERETRLAVAQPGLRADLLIAPHHGSASSSSPVLLNTLQPSVVLIQSGYRNRFGHPAPLVIDRYQARGMRWESSPQCGAATWRSDAPDQVLCHREMARRYWHHPGAETMVVTDEGEAGF